MNVRAPSEEKNYDSNENFYEELGQVFDHFPKYQMKIVLGDFNAKLGVISIRQLGMRVYIRIGIMMVLE
jgi:hypothetical protein